ncbi:MAG: family 1 encapsulin nanocompartment shell protein [Mycolicibacterium insubricum]
MNNLYRELAPITDAAWAQIEQEAARTFKRHIAGRRIVDVSSPSGATTAAIGTGHLRDVAAPQDGVIAHLREAQPLVRLRVPFTLNRTDIDDVIARALSELRLGTDVSIGYLSHDADTVALYLQETMTFLCYTAEASVALTV